MKTDSFNASIEAIPFAVARRRPVPAWPVLATLVVAWFVGGGCLRAETLAPMLDLPGTGRDPDRIDFRTMPMVRGQHAVVSHGNAPWPFRNHSYVAHFAGRYWCLWSHGLRQEDYPEQHVQYSTSADGLLWSESKPLVGPSPRQDFRYIARGFWVRDGRLLALASHDESYDATGKKKLFGPSLQLLAFGWNEENGSWSPLGVVAEDTINNFPPIRLPSGEWAMARRDQNFNVSLLVGGVDSWSRWNERKLVPADSGTGFRPDEPVLSLLADGRLIALYRDNGKSKRLFRAWSADQGKTWSVPARTNFPDATSKFFTLRTSRGYHVLVSNANPAPEQRVPLCVSLSEDGVTYTRMARLPVPTSPEDFLPRTGVRKAAGFQYPHVIEHDGALLIVYSRNMTTIETIKVSLDELERLRRGEVPGS